MSALRELLDAEATIGRRAVQARARRHVYLAVDARQLVLFQYAGNPYSVIGVACGRPGRQPDHVIGCPDPLHRADVAARLQPVRDDLLTWLGAHPIVVDRSDPERVRFNADDLPQLVVAGAGVIGALDNLSYLWRYSDGLDPAWAELGEELWALTWQRHRPGQAAVVGLAEALVEHFALGVSPLESAKLAVSVALCDAGPAGLSAADLRAAEGAESGPLGRPDQLDNPVWAAAKAHRRHPPAVVERTLVETWDRCNRAWAHLQALPEAPSATAAHLDGAWSWAQRVGPVRSGEGFRRRRALPTLAAAATELASLERAGSLLGANKALDDPMVAAELTGSGKAARADLVFRVTHRGRSTAISIRGMAEQIVPPAPDLLVGIAGTNVKARLAAVNPAPSGWSLQLEVGANWRNTSGIRSAAALADGPYWLVALAEPGPPGLPAPDDAPHTHPLARGRRQAPAAAP